VQPADVFVDRWELTPPFCLSHAWEVPIYLSLLRGGLNPVTPVGAFDFEPQDRDDYRSSDSYWSLPSIFVRLFFGWNPLDLYFQQGLKELVEAWFCAKSESYV
jgi:hypothetical protein